VGRLTERWVYEKQGVQSDSKQKRRALFLTAIEQIRPQVITGLYLTAFIPFVRFIAQRFKKYLDNASLPPNPSFSESIDYLRNIPEEEVRIATIGGWTALCRMKKTKEIRVLIESWAREHHLEATWCFDHAVYVLRLWLYDDRVRILQETPPSLIPDELCFAWADAVTDIQFDLAFSRAMLFEETHSCNSPDPPLFTFGWRKMSFEHAGWNYLQEGKEEWRKKVEEQFDIFKDQHKAKGQPVPKGALTALRKKLTSYLKKQDAEKQITVNQHELVKSAKKITEQGPERHMQWLAMYQIPPCQTYGEIAVLAGRESETIRKSVGAAAKLIGLTRRNAGEHAGRPIGSGGTPVRRTVYREKSLRPKKIPEK
jgi:hypothetical protein